MFEIVIERLAQSSDVILVMGVVIAVLFRMLMSDKKEAKKERDAHNKAIVKLTLSNSKKIEDLNADILQALIDSTAAMVSVDKNYTELRNEIKDKNNGN